MKKMSKMISFFSLFCTTFIFFSCKSGAENSFWGDGQQVFEEQKIFEGGQHPNVVVARDGSVIATYGREKYQIRRSEDGGLTWSPRQILADPGWQGGGVTVDETNGSIFIFVEEAHPPAPLTVFKSTDHGKTWDEHKVEIQPDINGNLPSMHMNESGITLIFGKHKGRLIRPSRVYAGGNGTEFWHLHYTDAIYSDDGGNTWQTSDPFPVMGTGEAALAELSDGTIYYNSRRHKSTDGRSPRWRYTGWSYDGGQSWEDVSLSEVLPDGNQHSDYGLMAGLVRLPIEGHDILLFSNIDMPKKENEEDYAFEARFKERKRGTVWASFDGGKTWPVKRLVNEGRFAYSSLAAGRKGTPSEGWIYLLYEGKREAGTGHGGHPAYIARFNLAWITGGRHWSEF